MVQRVDQKNLVTHGIPVGIGRLARREEASTVAAPTAPDKRMPANLTCR